MPELDLNQRLGLTMIPICDSPALWRDRASSTSSAVRGEVADGRRTRKGDPAVGRLYRTLIVIGLTFGIAHTGDCQTYRVDWCSVNSGAGLTSNGSHSLNCSLGQSSAGLVTDSNHLHWVGFWGGEVPDPLAVPGIGSVKLLADGSYVSLTGKIATSSLVDFDSFFYLE